MAALSRFCDSNMAVVPSCEKSRYKTQGDSLELTLDVRFFFSIFGLLSLMMQFLKMCDKKHMVRSLFKGDTSSKVHGVNIKKSQ